MEFIQHLMSSHHNPFLVELWRDVFVKILHFLCPALLTAPPGETIIFQQINKILSMIEFELKIK